jgi:MarR family transcriptional regulator, temperature-dependent positive regulator of motility
MLTAPGYFLRRLQQAYQAAWTVHVDQVVTSQQLAVLLAAHRHPGSEQGLIGASVALDRSTMAGVVDRLEKRGWLRRERSASDGRKRLIYLTAEGRKNMRSVLDRSQRLEATLMEGYGPHGQEMIVEMLGRLAERWEAVVDENGIEADGG